MKLSAVSLLRANFSRWIALIFLGGGLFCQCAQAQESGLPLVRSFAAAEIGTNARGWITVQDSDGVLHFGCDALVDFDGERWRTTPLRDAYALRGLDFGQDGRLWFAATGDIGWFERDAGQPWRVHSLHAKLPREEKNLGEVWHVFAEGAGAVFVAADKIVRWDGEKFRTWPMPGSRRLPAMRCAGAIYVQHPPTGLYLLGPEGPKLIIPAATLGNALVLWMEPRANGWLFATSRGLFTFDGEKSEPFAPAVSEYVRQHGLTAAARLADGRLALGTYVGGLVVAQADGTLDRKLTDDDGLPTRAIFSLFTDREGVLWATSPSHIFNVLVGSSSTVSDRRGSLPDLPILKLARHEGALLAATDRGVFRMLEDGRAFAPVEQLRMRLMDLRSSVRGLLVADFGEVKLVAADRTVKLYAGGENPFVVQPSRRWPGSFLISVGRSIVLADGEGHSRTLVRDLPDIATSVAEDSAGGLWIGTFARGIQFSQPDAAAPVEAGPASGLQGLPAASGSGVVVAAPNGAVLAFTRASGWIMSGESRRFEPIADFPSREVALVADEAVRDGVWIVHPGADTRPACVALISIANHRATWQPHAVDGLASIGEPRSIFAENSVAQGTVLWLGGTSGILRNAVAAAPVAPTPRRPLLRAFARGGERADLRPIAGVLPYDTRSVLFEFAAPEFSHRSSLRLQTRVEGVDEGWVPAGPEAQRELTAMRDGAYTFGVRAVAETGLVSEVATFGFIIAPPWWRTSPALVGALVLLGVATFGGFRLRVRALRRDNAVLEEKVRERTAQLARASAAKTQFVANMSHDIRNPLNGIVGLALALENSRLDHGQREIVATLRECTTYLSTLVDDVLDFASIESGRVTLRPGPFAPVELLRSVVATLRADTAQRGATLIVEAGPNLPATLFGDAGRIQQILVNYVTNALKYAGGRIRLSATVPPGSTGEIEFAVTDEGPGISEAEQTILFTKFTRLATGRETPIKGTGLGLASCRLLADIMDGSVGVVSDAGRGARFFLRLPLAVCAAEPETIVGALPQASVLVVEDTDYNAWAAAAVLSRLGLAHVRARSGTEALQLFSEKRYNVVLLDRNLPDMDGTEVARRIRELESDGPRAILLAVTAYCTADDRARCLEAGMDAFVGKPLTPDKLRNVLIAAGRQLLTAASVHAPSDAHSSAVDLTLLGYLSDGTEDGLDAQVERFLAALADAESGLAHAAAAREFLPVANAAHLVLSQAKLIGCTALEAAALALEHASRHEQPAAFGELLARVHREIAALTGALHHRPRAAHST